MPKRKSKGLEINNENVSPGDETSGCPRLANRAAESGRPASTRLGEAGGDDKDDHGAQVPRARIRILADQASATPVRAF